VAKPIFESIKLNDGTEHTYKNSSQILFIADRIKQPTTRLTRSSSNVLPKDGIGMVNDDEDVSLVSGMTSPNSESNSVALSGSNAFALRCRSNDDVLRKT